MRAAAARGRIRITNDLGTNGVPRSLPGAFTKETLFYRHKKVLRLNPASGILEAWEIPQWRKTRFERWNNWTKDVDFLDATYANSMPLSHADIITVFRELKATFGIDHWVAAAWQAEQFSKRSPLLRLGQGTMEMGYDGVVRVVRPDATKSFWTHSASEYFLFKHGSPPVPVGP
jgi:hypothetical protein